MIKKNYSNKKSGFTLIEILAVIIILGILVIVAIPSVTRLVGDSRKSAYVKTAKELINGAIAKVNDSTLDVRDMEVTYYVPTTCIETEGASKSPYGDFAPAYIVINYNGRGKGHEYYWISRDTSGMGVKELTKNEDLDEDDIVADLKVEDVQPTKSINDRKTIVVFNEDCSDVSNGTILPNGVYLQEKNCTYEGELTQGAQFTDGQYTYRYKQEASGDNWNNISGDGWGVRLTDKNSTDPVTTKICTSINEKPIISMYTMFLNSKATSIDVTGFDTSHVTNMGVMFNGATNITELDLSGFVTTNVTNVSAMFSGATSLKKVNLDNWDVTLSGYNSGGVFSGANALEFISMRNWIIGERAPYGIGWSWSGTSPVLTKIDVTGWDLTNTRNIYGALAGMAHLTTIIGLETWDTSNIRDMGCLFNGDSALTEIDLSTFNTKHVTNMSAMFYNASSLTSINLDNWNLSSFSDSGSGGGFFSGCTSLKTVSAKNWIIPKTFANWISRTWSLGSSLETLDVTGWDLRYAEDINGLFGSSSNLKNLIGLDTWKNTSKLYNISYLFNGCSSLETINMDNWDTTGLNQYNYSVFSGCTSLTSLSLKNWKVGSYAQSGLGWNWGFSQTTMQTVDVSNWDLSNTTSLYGFFGGCYYLKNIIGLETWDTSHVSTMSSLFSGCNNLTSLNVSSFNTSNVTSFSSMFYGCNGLTSLNLSNFNTSKATDMSYMFQNCYGLTSLNLSNFDVSNVYYFYYMFYGCYGLTSLNLSNFVTTKATSMYYMFYNCNNLTSLNISNFVTNNVTSMYYMFYNCNKLTSLNLSNFNTANVTNMYYMFYNCSGLTSLNVSSFNTAKVTNMSYMFYGCSGLTSLNVSNFNTAKVTNMNCMFYGCTNLLTMDISNFDTSNVTSMTSMFYNCTSLQSVNMDNKNLLKLSGTSGGGNFFYGCNSLKTVSAKNWTIPSSFSHWLSRTWSGSNSQIETIDVTGWNLTSARDIQGLFADAKKLKTITGLNTWNTQYVTNMQQMFYNCMALESLNLSSFNTANVTSMNGMFYYCQNLEELNLSNFNTSNVTNMSIMFYYCSKLTSLDLSNFNVSKVTTFGGMLTGCNAMTSINLDNWDMRQWTSSSPLGGIFSGMTGLKTISAKNWKIPASFTHLFSRTMSGGGSPIETIDVTGWDLTNARDIQGAFGDCKSLKNIIGLNTWNTQYITNMLGMFQNCQSLTSLSLTNFNTANVTTMNVMFSGCTNLTTLDLSSFDVTQISDSNLASIFNNSPALTTGYAKSQANADKLNQSSTGKPSGMTFIVRT